MVDFSTGGRVGLPTSVYSWHLHGKHRHSANPCHDMGLSRFCPSTSPSTTTTASYDFTQSRREETI